MDEDVQAGVKAAWERVRVIEPRVGLGGARLADVRAIVEAMEAALARRAEVPEGDRAAVAQTATAVHARAAALAVAGRDLELAQRWLTAATSRCGDPDQQAILAAATRDPGRYRTLVHARYLFANDDRVGGRHLADGLIGDGDADAGDRDGGGGDAIAGAARRLVSANTTPAARPTPRTESAPVPSPPTQPPQPTQRLWHGFGVGFHGRRDVASDGAYTTTQWVKVFGRPLIPLAAFRVRDDSGGPVVLSSTRLTGRGRTLQIAMMAMLVIAWIGYFGYGELRGYLHGPDRMARQRFDAAIAAADRGDREAALAGLDAELAGPDAARVGAGRHERAGAAVVRLTAELVPTPFTADRVDQATRVVRRYQALPSKAQEGVARVALLGYLDGWIAAVADAPEAQLVLLREAVAVARAGRDHARVTRLDGQVSALRLALARARADSAPMDAVGVLLDGPPDPATIAAASALLEGALASPSLLDDARPDVDAWLAAVSASDPRRARVIEARDRGAAGRAEAEADDVTAAALTAMQAARPWDQRVGLALARAELERGELAAADARLRAFGPPGRLIRDARFALAQIAIGQGRLDDADALLTDLLAVRVARFAAASAALDDAARRVDERLDARFRAEDIPADLRTTLTSATATDDDKRAAVAAWARTESATDRDVMSRREAFEALADVVPTSIALGSVELRRAQGLTGADRDRMLADAERRFLAIQNQAEGQPEFELGLGEIAARLGKNEESEAAFARVLARAEPALTLGVARIYRDLGRVERARQVATDLFATASGPFRDGAAVLLALLATSEDEAERWYRKASSADPFVAVALLELEAGRLLRAGKTAACAARFAEVAKAHLAQAGVSDLSGYNNAALAYARAYRCSGDPAALRQAASTLERAYRLRPDEPIVVANLADMLAYQARLRVLGRRIAVHALTLSSDDADALSAVLRAGSERAAVLAELAADAGWRRSGELLAQVEVLAPSNPHAYVEAFDQAAMRRDATAAAAVLARMKQARALDTSRMTSSRARWIAGELDRAILDEAAADIARLTAALAQPKVDARTRAAAQLLIGRARKRIAMIQPAPALLATARDELAAAMATWPALEVGGEQVSAVIDQAGFAAGDVTRWRDLRRLHGAAEAVAVLAAAADPLASAVRASPPWAEVPALARAVTDAPGIDDLRLARLLGDADLLARAAAARTDELVRLRVELRRLIDPTDPSLAADLAVLDAP